MAGFQGFAFPGMTVQGMVPQDLREALVTFNARAVNAVNQPAKDSIAWIDDVSAVGSADWIEKIPIDITALIGFKPFKGGARDPKEVDLLAVAVEVQEWDLPFNYKSKFIRAGTQQMMNLMNIGPAIVGHARSLKAELGASILMNSVDTKLYTSLPAAYVATAMCYPELGFPLGMPLFSSTDGTASNNGGHLVNPRDARFGRFPNYFPGFGKFNEANFALMRTLMRTVPSPVTDRRTLGGQVNVVWGASHMEEPFRQVYKANLVLKSASFNGTPVAASGTGIYAADMTPWIYRVASQLDHHPYLENFRAKFQAANGRQPTVAELPHQWWSCTQDLEGAHGIEFASPGGAFMPKITIFGIGSEHEAETKMVTVLPDLEGGGAAGVPHVIQYFEEDRG